MYKKKGTVIKILLSLIPFVVFIIYAVMQIPVCMRYDYPAPMLGIEAMNWFDAWGLNVGIVLMYSLIVLIPCFIILIINIIRLIRNKKRNERCDDHREA